MKKIMFNDRFGLTSAVLNGTKTMTRRILKVPVTEVNAVNQALKCDENVEANKQAIIKKYAQYQIGEEVAVAQSYKHIYDVMEEHGGNSKANEWWCNLYSHLGDNVDPLMTAGYSNKMFVLAELMPHRIRITDVKAERLQDISEEDAMREGIFKYDKPPLHHEGDPFAPWPPYVKPYKNNHDNLVYRCSARWAFAYLIDKVCGGGTWERNPWVFAYTFELIK